MNGVTRIVVGVGLALLITACGKQEAPAPVTASANSSELPNLLKRCRQDRAAVGDAACRAAQEEYQRRFMNPGRPPYEPKPSGASSNSFAAPPSAPSKDVR